MATSARAFLVELYEEYLEEASFLYEQRLSLFSNPEITWKKIGEFEERLEAHIDGLVVGDSLALEVCIKHSTEADFGELFAMICVFCRQNRRDLVLAALEQLGSEDLETALAITDALKYELPDAWIQDLLVMLGNGDPKLTPILARALGYRRVPCGPQLLSAMRRCSSAALPEVVWALGRVRHKPAKEPLQDLLRSEVEPIRSAASLALARIGDRRALDYCMDTVRSKAWPTYTLGVAGGPNSVSVLAELAEEHKRPDCLLALGLQGDPSAIPLLLQGMEQPDSAAASAAALDCITGAGLREEVFVPDEVDEDELFESERENFKPGDPLMRGDGKPFGFTLTRISQKTDAWSNWFHEKDRNFVPGLRYRYGKPIGPEQLVATLSRETTPYVLRQSCSEELAIRYGYDFGFEADMQVVRQIEVLKGAATWSRSEGSRFEAGRWFFAANVQRY